MALANYADLVAAIPNWMSRSNAKLTNVIPDLVTLAEVRHKNDLKLKSQVVVLPGTTASETIALPSRFSELQSLVFSYGGSDVALQYVPPEEIERYGIVTGLADRYTIIGDNIKVARPPDTTYSYTLTYYQDFGGLKANSTNWLMTNAPNVYLYAVLLEACLFVKDDKNASKWAVAYQNAVDKLVEADEKATRGTVPVITSYNPVRLG